MRDNQLPERREVRGEVEQPPTLETEVEADGAVEKGLGPTDALLRACDPYEFQPLTIEMRQDDKDKADHQDKDEAIKLVKEWVKEG